MRPPFTTREFFDVLGAYNTAFWPIALALWVMSVAVVIQAFRRGEFPERVTSLLLAVQWAWAGIAYHALFFTRLSPAGWLFAAMFAAEAMLLAWTGAVEGALRFASGRSPRHLAAYALVAFGLIYPFVTLAEGFVFPRAPLFAVPCPTTILTVGVLLTLERPRWDVAIVPIAWAGIGGSAAVLFGVHADAVLFLSGLALLLDVVVRGTFARGGGRRPVAS